jgi:hypothetical protein
MKQTAWKAIYSLIARREATGDSETYAEAVARFLADEKRQNGLGGAKVAVSLREGKFVWIDLHQNEAKDDKEKSATK